MYSCVYTAKDMIYNLWSDLTVQDTELKVVIVFAWASQLAFSPMDIFFPLDDTFISKNLSVAGSLPVKNRDHKALFFPYWCL